MADMEFMDTAEELRFYKDVHKILDDAKNKTYAVAKEVSFWKIGVQNILIPISGVYSVMN